MYVPAFYVHQYMAVQMIGQLSAMIWHVIYIGIIKRAKKCSYNTILIKLRTVS